MAHVLKIKQGSVAPLVAHYERTPELARGFERENIDSTRTGLNYNLRPSDVVEDVQLAILQHEQTAQRAVRSDANVLFDWVVTLPKDCPLESTRAFFESVVEFIEERYGRGNVVGAYVHMDETTPHIHVPVLPMIDGKLQASKMVNRQDLRTFHGELAEHVDRALGFHVSVELSEEQHIEKAMNSLDQGQMKLAAERLESLQRETREAEEAVEESRPEAIGEAARTIAGSRGLGARERSARERGSQLRARIEQLRGRIEQVRERIGEVAREIARAPRRPRIVVDPRQRERGARSLADDVRDARAASEAWNRQRGRGGQGRSAGRGSR